MTTKAKKKPSKLSTDDSITDGAQVNLERCTVYTSNAAPSLNLLLLYLRVNVNHAPAEQTFPGQRTFFQL
jgi:hypothetical protein